jgi:peroxiredoxin
VAVSTDSPEEGREFIEEDGIGFPIAADVSGETIRRWGLSEKGRSRSVPATFVVDERGVILFARVGTSVTDRVRPEEILDVLDGR